MCQICFFVTGQGRQQANNDQIKEWTEDYCGGSSQLYFSLVLFAHHPDVCLFE